MASQPAFSPPRSPQPLFDSVAAGAWLDRLAWPSACEAVAIVALDRQMAPIRTEWLGRGGPSFTPVFARRLVAVALMSGASGLVLAHNHPSGCSRPSLADLRVTRELTRLLSALDIRLLDHLILGADGWRSLRDAKLI